MDSQISKSFKWGILKCSQTGPLAIIKYPDQNIKNSVCGAEYPLANEKGLWLQEKMMLHVEVKSYYQLVYFLNSFANFRPFYLFLTAFHQSYFFAIDLTLGYLYSLGKTFSTLQHRYTIKYLKHIQLLLPNLLEIIM